MCEEPSFDTPTETASPSEGVAIGVVVEAPLHSGVEAVLSYRSEQVLAPGTLVRVPLGRRVVTGMVWLNQEEGGEERAEGGAKVTPKVKDRELKAVQEVLASLPPLAPTWCRLVAFAAGYYQRALGELALAVLPPEMRKLSAEQLARRLTKLEKRLKATPTSAEPDGTNATDATDATDPTAAATAPGPELTDEQRAVVAQVEDDGAQVHLLHGATGSGKTEVYLQLAARQLEQGRQALVLVPEINLTPQLEARFRARFPHRRVVSMHSGLTPPQRLQAWLIAHLGRADIMLGTRMAVFASLPRLGLIVVDEEHDPSYKQQEGARYSARDLAVYRGKLEGIPVLLGSATPSLESWHHSERGRYRRLAMPTRIGAARAHRAHGVDGGWPAVRLIDMTHTPRGAALSPALVEALRQRVARGEQSLVFLNRRGYSPVLHCLECGWKSGCPHCSAWRVFHKSDRSLRCHHCGLSERVPRACPECGNPDIQALGRGTERLEEQLAEHLPGARIVRVDADTTRLKGMLEARLAQVHAGEVDVLVGTQMVAKGHDFRRVTLVAAINPDAALFSSDFRAGERLFALLMQAAGRAGRDAAMAHTSEVMIQTYHPAHPLYAALKAHDFEAFAAQQLREREMAGMPPFSHLALVRAEARTQESALAYLEAVSAEAAALYEGGTVTLYPPVPMAVQRIANIERVQMLVESASRPALQRFLAQWAPVLHARRGEYKGLVRWAIDVDPLAI